MKKFIEPSIKVTKFASEDVITTSTYMVEINTTGYTGAVNEVADNMGFFLDGIN